MVAPAVEEGELTRLRRENAVLRAALARAESNGRSQPREPIDPLEWDELGHGMHRDEIARYSRQIVLPSFGVMGEYMSWGHVWVQYRADPQPIRFSSSPKQVDPWVCLDCGRRRPWISSCVVPGGCGRWPYRNC